VYERQVVSGFELPPDEQRPKPIMPTVRALHDPASRLAVHSPEQRRLALLADVRRDPPRSHRRVAIAEGIAFVEAAVLGAPHAASTSEHHGIERRSQRPLVMQIRPAQNDRERDAAAIGQNMALRAALGSVGWVRSREIPPFGAFTITESSAPHIH